MKETRDDVFNRSLRMAVEYGFKSAEKGQNLDMTLLKFERLLKADSHEAGCPCMACLPEGGGSIVPATR